MSVAAVRGHAIGAGFQLALACDLRVLADDAKLCMKEPALGLVPDLTGTKPLVDIVGLPRALELCLTARIVDAAEAAVLRLAELVVPGAELDAAVGRPGRRAAGHRRRGRPGDQGAARPGARPATAAAQAARRAADPGRTAARSGSGRRADRPLVR